METQIVREFPPRKLIQVVSEHLGDILLVSQATVHCSLSKIDVLYLAQLSTRVLNPV